MAELGIGLAKATVDGALKTAKSAIEEEVKAKKGVKRDLIIIKDELEVMHSVLNVSSDYVAGDDDVKRAMVRQVRNLALDLEDCIESAVHVRLDDGRCTCTWWRYMLPVSLLPSYFQDVLPGADLEDAAANIELFKARLDAMGQRNLRYSRITGGDSGPSPNKPAEQPAAAITTSESSSLLTRREAEKKQQGKQVRLAELIIISNKVGAAVPRLRVISVLGTVGTMSIIKEAFEDKTVCGKFGCLAWVKMEHSFNPHRFIRSLLAQFNRNGARKIELKKEATQPDALIDEFTKQMSSEKHLVILEGVSSMVDWEAVRVYLSENNKGSCIIVNTNQVEVAALCVGYHPYHRKLDFLQHASGPALLELEKFSADLSVCALLNKVSVDNLPTKVAGEWFADEGKQKIAREWLREHEHKLVGHEEEKSLLEMLVLKSGRRVVPVCGMSGIGKTFLVRHFYYKLLIDQHGGEEMPGLFGWVDVSRPFDLMDLSRGLVCDLNPRSLQKYKMEKVKDPIEECHEYLHPHDSKRSFYIVVDGVESREELDKINVIWLLGLRR